MRDHLETNDSKIWMLIFRLNFVVLTTFKKFLTVGNRCKVVTFLRMNLLEGYSFRPRCVYLIMYSLPKKIICYRVYPIEGYNPEVFQINKNALFAKINCFTIQYRRYGKHAFLTKNTECTL